MFVPVELFCIHTRLSFDPFGCVAKNGAQHADYYAEGFSERPATAWSRRDNPERSSGHRRVAE
jgi:hypothetical protein